MIAAGMHGHVFAGHTVQAILPRDQGTIAALREWIGVALEQMFFVITTIGTIGPGMQTILKLLKPQKTQVADATDETPLFNASLLEPESPVLYTFKDSVTSCTGQKVSCSFSPTEELLKTSSVCSPEQSVGTKPGQCPTCPTPPSTSCWDVGMWKFSMVLQWSNPLPLIRISRENAEFQRSNR